MIGSLFNDLQPIEPDDSEISETAEDLSYGTDSDDSLVASLPLVKKIVRRKSIVGWQSDAADIVQAIALRLLKWRGNNQEKSEEMSPDEWQSFAARTAFNEINRQNSNKLSVKEVPLEDVSEIVTAESVEGQSEAELQSLTRIVWQKICSLTLRQRYALLLHNRQVLINLMQGGITDEEFAASLEMPLEDWLELREQIRLPDNKIAELVFERRGGKSLQSLEKSIKKARYEARAQLRRVTDK